jgi:predicted lactoylglutathione lyase
MARWWPDGGTTPFRGEKAREPEDYGFMFVRSIHDPDGHVWEFFSMDESKLPPK